MSEQIDLTDYADSDSEEDSEWVEKRLGEIFESIYSGGTPKKGVDEYYDGDIPFVKIEDLNEQRGGGVTTAENYITEQALEETSTRAFDSGTLLMTIYGSLAETALVQSRVATNQGILGLWDADDDNVLYVRYAIDNSQPKLASLSRQTTQANLGKGIVKKHKIPIPPLPEQRKIATVLYTVDRAIEKTEEIIEQYRRVYTGLLQSEFHEAKEDDTKDAGALGRIPVSWSIVPISDVAEVTMGNSPKSEHYNSDGDGLPFYQGANEFGERSPTADRWCSAPKKVGKPGDTLLNIRSHTNVGKINKAHHECCIGRGLAAITPGEKIDGDYLYHHLRERENYINSIASGSTFDSVNTEEVESVKIALPPMDTQRAIASSLNNIQNGILNQKIFLEKFGRLKHGLMQDLLSGTVRTTDTNIEVPDEIAQHG